MGKSIHCYGMTSGWAETPYAVLQLSQVQSQHIRNVPSLRMRRSGALQAVQTSVFFIKLDVLILFLHGWYFFFPQQIQAVFAPSLCVSYSIL